MLFKQLKDNKNILDTDFNTIYPSPLNDLAGLHFSPITVIQEAIEFLVQQEGTRVLDIGSGAGKFCMVGASCSTGVFTGVEQHEHLHLISKKMSKFYQIKDVHFIHQNINTINFSDYDAFYFFNSFYENLDTSDSLISNMEINRDLYHEYSAYVYNQLQHMPIGTRLVSYFSYNLEIPNNYLLQSSSHEGKLKMWVKTT